MGFATQELRAAMVDYVASTSLFVLEDYAALVRAISGGCIPPTLPLVLESSKRQKEQVQSPRNVLRVIQACYRVFQAMEATRSHTDDSAAIHCMDYPITIVLSVLLDFLDTELRLNQ